jgi:hypothetical protein
LVKASALSCIKKRIWCTSLKQISTLETKKLTYHVISMYWEGYPPSPYGDV